MERLDTQYATYKQLSQDSSKTTEERAAAAEKLSEREIHLQPAYKQLALLYADLHEYVSLIVRMRTVLTFCLTVVQGVWKLKAVPNQ